MSKDDCKRCFGKGYRFMAGHSAHEDNTEPCGDCSGTGKTPFVREDRYIVIKRKDLREAPELARHALHVALEGVREHLPHRECAVVESDWPEHDVVWAAIEERMANGGRPPVAGDTQSYEEGFYALAAALGFSAARSCSAQTALHGLMLPAIEHLKDAEAAHREFSDKTDWVQSPSTPARFLGQHRADIIRTMLRDAECARDALRQRLERCVAALQGVLDDNCPLTGEPSLGKLREHWLYEERAGNGAAAAWLDALEALRESGSGRTPMQRTTGVEATPRTTGVGSDPWDGFGYDVLPGGAMAASAAQAALSPPSEPVLLRDAIAYAVRAQTGSSVGGSQTRARAAMLLLSIDETTVVVGGE